MDEDRFEDEDEYGNLRSDEGEDSCMSRPDFGCACESPLVVDSVCPYCVYNMRRQEAEAEGGLRWLLWRVNERLELWTWGVAARFNRWRDRRKVNAALADDDGGLPF